MEIFKKYVEHLTSTLSLEIDNYLHMIIKRFLKEEYVHIYVGNSGVELYIRIGQNRSRV